MKDRWVNRARQLPHIDLLTPTDPQRSCAIAAFSVKEKSGKEVADILLKQHNIFTVALDINGTSAVRVTPQLYNTVEQMEKLAGALERFG